MKRLLPYITAFILFPLIFIAATCEGPTQSNCKADSLMLILKDTTSWPYGNADSTDITSLGPLDNSYAQRLRNGTWQIRNAPTAINELIKAINQRDKECDTLRRSVLAATLSGDSIFVHLVHRTLDTSGGWLFPMTTYKNILEFKFRNPYIDSVKAWKNVATAAHLTNERLTLSIQDLTFERDAEIRYRDEMIAVWKSRVDSAAKIIKRQSEQLANSTYNKPKH